MEIIKNKDEIVEIELSFQKTLNGAVNSNPIKDFESFLTPICEIFNSLNKLILETNFTGIYTKFFLDDEIHIPVDESTFFHAKQLGYFSDYFVDPLFTKDSEFLPWLLEINQFLSRIEELSEEEKSSLKCMDLQIITKKGKFDAYLEISDSENIVDIKSMEKKLLIS